MKVRKICAAVCIGSHSAGGNYRRNCIVFIAIASVKFGIKDALDEV
jgi:hypothetical protein